MSASRTGGAAIAKGNSGPSQGPKNIYWHITREIFHLAWRTPAYTLAGSWWILFFVCTPVYYKASPHAALITGAVMFALFMVLGFVAALDKADLPKRIRKRPKRKTNANPSHEPHFRDALSRAYWMEGMGQLGQALKLADNLLAEDPADYNAITLKGRLLDAFANRDALLAHYRASLPHLDADTRGLMTAPCYRKRIVELDPSDLETVWELAWTVYDIGEALPYFERLLSQTGLAATRIDYPTLLDRLDSLAKSARDALPRHFHEMTANQKRQLAAVQRAEGCILARDIAALPRELTGLECPRDPDVRREPSDGKYTYVPPEDLRLILARIRKTKSVRKPLPAELENAQTEFPHRLGILYDPNSIFHAFTMVRRRSGYALDWVWRGDRHGGSPLVYARAASEPRLQTVAAFEQRVGISVSGYGPSYPEAFLSAVEFEDTDIGLVEFALFLSEVSNFYRFWHAHYAKVKFFSEPSRSNELGTMDEAGSARWQSMFSGARIRRLESGAEVSLLTFPGSEGHMVRTWRVRAPDVLLGVQDEMIAKSNTRTLY